MISNHLCKEEVHQQALRLMGNHFVISVVYEDELYAQECIDKAVTEIRRIESLLTTFRETSQTNIVNQNAGVRPVKVDREVFEILTRCRRLSDLTQGAFDITYGSVDKSLWNFDTSMTSLPDKEVARRSVRLINYKNVILDNNDQSVFLKHEGMRIGFGGIGKGYAAERAKKLLQSCGIESGIVNASGDLAVWGNAPGGKKWKIGLADPELRHLPFSSLDITDTAIATSGNYEKYAVIDGKRYSHTIDPKTGMPVHGIRSVTIVCNNAELADAMTTPVMIMGVKAGLNMVDQIHGMACVIVDDENNLHSSKNIRLC